MSSIVRGGALFAGRPARGVVRVHPKIPILLASLSLRPVFDVFSFKMWTDNTFFYAEKRLFF